MANFYGSLIGFGAGGGPAFMTADESSQTGLTVTEDGEEELDPISLETYKKQKFEWFTEQVDWEYDEDKESNLQAADGLYRSVRDTSKQQSESSI